MKINEVIVVEGEHDSIRLKQLFDVDTIITNGSAISEKTLSLIAQVNKSRGVIIFCDPDFAGDKIRKKIMKYVPDALHAFLPQEKAVSKSKRKIGVEHAKDEDLYSALEYVVTFKQNNESLLYDEYLTFGLVGNKQKRKYLCDQLNIDYSNAKTLFKRLNMLNKSYDDIEKIMRCYSE